MKISLKYRYAFSDKPVVGTRQNNEKKRDE